MSREIKVYVLTTICCLLSVTSCKDKKDTFSFDYQYDYYPLMLGHYVEYDVDSITYLFNGNYLRDTARYQFRELVADTFYDNLDQLNYVLELYRREDSLSTWQFDKKWFVRFDSLKIMKTEDDIKFVKLVFPPKAALTWDGNEYIPSTFEEPYNVFKDWDYHYSTVDTTVTINGLTFEHAVVVGQVDKENVIEKTLRKEIYAKGIGMIYQEWEDVNKNKNITTNWEVGPEGGFRIRMKVRGYYP